MNFPVKSHDHREHTKLPIVFRRGLRGATDWKITKPKEAQGLLFEVDLEVFFNQQTGKRIKVKWIWEVC